MRQTIFCVLILTLSLAASSAFGKNEKNLPRTDKWTVQDTVSAAIGYSPSVKREKEGVAMQKESVRQAKAGHLPRIDLEASGGAATLPVSRYD